MILQAEIIEKKLLYEKVKQSWAIGRAQGEIRHTTTLTYTQHPNLCQKLKTVFGDERMTEKTTQKLSCGKTRRIIQFGCSVQIHKSYFNSFVSRGAKMGMAKIS